MSTGQTTYTYSDTFLAQISDDSVKLVWRPDEETIAEYSVESGPDEDSLSLLREAPGHYYYLVIPNLIPSTNYAFRVTGYDINKIPVYSETIALKTLTIRPTTTFNRTLSRGFRSNEVTALQAYLATDKSLYPEGLITSYFGPLTEKAVQRFQVRYNIAGPGIPGYGNFGPKTRKALNELMEKAF